jgi:uncharacterized membrane protein (DUF106 family)
MRVCVYLLVLSKMKPNMRAIQEYRRKEKEYLVRAEQLEKTTQERDMARKIYDQLRKQRFVVLDVGGVGIVCVCLLCFAWLRVSAVDRCIWVRGTCGCGGERGSGRPAFVVHHAFFMCACFAVSCVVVWTCS